MTRRVPHKLARARAYWRIAAKANKAGNYREGARYRETGDRAYREYQREEEFLANRIERD